LQDDSSIDDDEPFWRFVPPAGFSPDESGHPRLNSGAFYSRSDTDGPSGFFAKRADRQRLSDFFGPECGIAEITAAEVRQVGFGVVKSDAEGIDEPHATFVPDPTWGQSQREKRARKLKDVARVVSITTEIRIRVAREFDLKRGR
jgi:hypothetical protein